MWFNLSSSLLILAASCGIQHIANAQVRLRRCETTEECKDLRNCSSLLKLLENKTIANIRKLQQSVCGFEGNTPKVCCAKKVAVDVNIGFPSESTPTTLPPGNRDLLPSLPSCGQPALPAKVFGGERPPIGAYPWMVALGYEEPGVNGIQFLCGGALINRNYVLTAAHCLTRSSLGTKTLRVLRFGENDLANDRDCFREVCSDDVIDIEPDEIIIHELYNNRTSHSDDIALIRLAQPVTYSTYVQPICLPEESVNVEELVNGRNLAVAGWGLTETGSLSDVLLHVKLPFADLESCNVTYGGRLNNDQICAGGAKGRDSCGGDSGGPLVISGQNGPPFFHVGVVSFGPPVCGLENTPAVYTDTTKYIRWILSKLRA